MKRCVIFVCLLFEKSIMVAFYVFDHHMQFIAPLYHGCCGHDLGVYRVHNLGLNVPK